MTEWLEVIVKTQVVPLPEQSPDQPENSEPAKGMALKATGVPLAYDSAQSAPQSIPFIAVTVPKSTFEFITLSEYIFTQLPVWQA